ncbi:MAG: hypothetical protein EOP37_22325 [Rubrivivax sp.]|nr:MAG: hypothetical protein EOP37_22325 [Rubrivivax sp.]
MAHSQVTNELSMFDRSMRMWRELDFPVLADDSDELNRYLHCLRKTYENGSVLHRTFSIPEHQDLDDFLLRGQLHSAFFFERFWQAKSVQASLPYSLHEVNFLGTDLFRWVHPVELFGSMARVLVAGGAYGHHVPSARDAMGLATNAAAFLLGGDFEESKVFVAHSAWSAFFFDVAWDYTCLVIQPANRKIHVVLATDTD